MALAMVHSPVQKRENPPSFDEGFPKIVNLAGDDQRNKTVFLQRQHLIDRGLRPAFALIAAELIFGGGER